MAKPKNGAEPVPAVPTQTPEDSAASAPVQPAPAAAPPEVDYLDQVMRLKAEFENYRKRVDREKPEYLRLGRVTVLGKLLPLYDLLQQAHRQVQAEHNDTPLAEGMEGIFKEFDKLFREEGVAAMDPLNKPFDALHHEVFGTADREDVPEGTVVDVLQNGFMMQDRVLRTATVRIARRPKTADGPAPAGKIE